jgi:hypothetical protein
MLSQESPSEKRGVFGLVIKVEKDTIPTGTEKYIE